MWQLRMRQSFSANCWSILYCACAQTACLQLPIKILISPLDSATPTGAMSDDFKLQCITIVTFSSYYYYYYYYIKTGAYLYKDEQGQWQTDNVL